jgi:hypothetical protein
VLSKGKRDQKICEVQIDGASEFHERHLKTIHHTYRRARFYADYAEELAAILRRGHAYLAELNIELIEWLRGSIGIGGN